MVTHYFITILPRRSKRSGFDSTITPIMNRSSKYSTKNCKNITLFTYAIFIVMTTLYLKPTQLLLEQGVKEVVQQKLAVN